MSIPGDPLTVLVALALLLTGAEPGVSEYQGERG